ncbi:SpoIIE family protein phosphatase [Anaeroselena agilis]|uniref:SpoIIE family protein phosphatase n=1 Tax=Anaeroselena agilis TaxID=3063788 RepID=A0ABU3NSR6_9FIRM|nr:SpoIIE family protein phosphatase [Selenomonadales bacterium 4137-cl]
MFHNMSIRWRLFASVLAAAALILATVIGYGYLEARHMLEEELEAKAWQLSNATANRILTVETTVEKVAGGLAAATVMSPDAQDGLYPLLERLLADNEEISGIAVAWEPAYMARAGGGVSPSVYRVGNRVARGNLAAGGANYTVTDWYALPRNLLLPCWSEPHSAGSGNDTLMVTYSVPLYAQTGKNSFIGVVKCDVSLEWLHELLLSLPLEQNGYAFLLSRNGTYVAHPQKNFILKENIFSRAEEQGNPLLRKLGREMVKGRSGYIRYDNIVSDEKGWLLYQPISSTGWVLGVFFPQEAMTAKVIELSRKEAAIGLIGFLLLLPVMLFIARSITRPLLKLDKAARTLATGDLDAPLPELRGKDEVARLAESFTTMRNELKVHLAMLEQTAANRERIESELRIARDIQMDLVPKTFPPFPNRREFELYAVMNPARQVGGDFYDFFMPDDEHICVAIGDVSGKGVPAALFMAVTRTLLRAFLQNGDSPGEALRHLNDDLAQNNDYCMFVTVFCLVVHLPSGRCRFANGGHNLPCVLRADGSSEYLPKTQGAALGVMEGLQIAESEAFLAPGDTAFFYTDGVTEAMNCRGELFGDDRMTKELATHRSLSCKDLLGAVAGAVAAHADGAEQSDDITMLAFRYFGQR